MPAAEPPPAGPLSHAGCEAIDVPAPWGVLYDSSFTRALVYRRLTLLAPVPEPSTTVMLVAGALLLAWRFGTRGRAVTAAR